MAQPKKAIMLSSLSAVGCVHTQCRLNMTNGSCIRQGSASTCSACALHKACALGKIDEVRQLLNDGIDPALRFEGNPG